MFDIIAAAMEVWRRMFILPSKLDGVYAFIMMLSAVIVIDVANRKYIYCVARYRLVYGPAPIRGPAVGEYCCAPHYGAYQFQNHIYSHQYIYILLDAYP